MDILPESTAIYKYLGLTSPPPSRQAGPRPPFAPKNGLVSLTPLINNPESCPFLWSIVVILQISFLCYTILTILQTWRSTTP